ncbi:MAG TPA: hypothetical protein VFX15_12415 [Actinomycetes bacterium]|nr:hypothetical protein [Actinomycetes bacterium]
MWRSATLGIPGVGIGLDFAFPAAGGLSASDTAESDADLTFRLLEASDGEPLTFDQDEAIQLGYQHVLVKDDLPVCPDPQNFEGYASSEELAAAVKAADTGHLDLQALR